jgi:hypothetical protein
MLPSVDKITAPTSNEVKKVIMGMKNNEAPSTDHLWEELEIWLE